MYCIKVWETKYDRNQGIASCYDDYTNLDDALFDAEDYFENAESVEVVDEQGNVIKGFYPEDRNIKHISL